MKKKNLIFAIYKHLFDAFGPQHWWPGDTTEEIIIGAVLTQNTSWENVRKALDNLKNAGALNLETISKLSTPVLASLIRPSGYYNIKEKRLRAVADFFLSRCGGDFSRLKSLPLEKLRSEILEVYGVGPETADSILLYALDRPVFVVDAYTMRMGRRHGLFDDRADYESVRSLFESSLDRSLTLFNEYHALLVRLGKEFCRKRPGCRNCPLHSSRFYSKAICR